METTNRVQRTRLKVCCIASIEEAQLAVSYGADAVGLVGAMPSGPGPIADGLIATISAMVPPPTARFLLTSETTAVGIIEHVRRTGVNTVQIVDDEVEYDVYEPIREALPAVKIVQVIHVCDEGSIRKASIASAVVDALLLDSGNPQAAIRELGGTGRVHNWEISREIVSQSPKPVFLAGGLNHENVASAVSIVRPYGIDVCSGVRQNGMLCRDKLSRFVAALRMAD